MKIQNLLDEFRKQIDTVDTLLIKCLAKRQEFAREIAELKKQANMQIFQPERERQMIESRKELASGLGIDSMFIELIFRDILENSRKIQEEQWKLA